MNMKETSSSNCRQQQKRQRTMTLGKLTTTTMKLLSMSSFVLLLVTLVVVQGAPASALKSGATSTEDIVITAAAVTTASSFDEEKDYDINYSHDDDDADVLVDYSSFSSDDQDVEPSSTVASLSSSSSSTESNNEDEEDDITKKNVVVFVRPSKNNHAHGNEDEDEDEYSASIEEEEVGGGGDEEQDEGSSMMINASAERNRHLLSSTNVSYERLMQEYFENANAYNTKWNGPGITVNSNLAYSGSGSQLLNKNRVLKLKSSNVMNGSSLDYKKMRMRFKFRGLGWQSGSRNKGRLNVQMSYNSGTTWATGGMAHIIYGRHFENGQWMDGEVIISPWGSRAFIEKDKLLFRFRVTNAITNGERIYFDRFTLDGEVYSSGSSPKATSWGPWNTISNEIFNYETKSASDFAWSVAGSQSFPSSGGQTGFTITPMRSLEMTNGATTATTWKRKLSLNTGDYNQVQVIVWFNFYKLAAGDQLVLESSNNNGSIWRFANSWKFDTLRNGQHDTMITTFTEGASGPNLAWSSASIKFKLKAVGLTNSNYIYIDRVLIRGRKWTGSGTPTAGDEYYGSPEANTGGTDTYDPNGGYSVENNGPLVVSARTGTSTTGSSPHRGRGRIPSNTGGKFPSAADKLTTSDSDAATEKNEEVAVVEEETEDDYDYDEYYDAVTETKVEPAVVKEEAEDYYDYDEYYYVAETAELEPYIAPEAFNVNNTSDGPLIIESSTSSFTPDDRRRRHLEEKEKNQQEDVVVRRDHAKRRGFRQR